MNRQVDIIRQLQRMGKDPSGPIDQADYDKARLAIRKNSEIAKDAARMFRARTEKMVRLMQVPDSKAIENLTVCRSNECGSYGRLSNGLEVCHRCNCTGKDLHNKAANRREKCPAGLWDNTLVNA
jgi:hypothetical protein